MLEIQSPYKMNNLSHDMVVLLMALSQTLFVACVSVWVIWKAPCSHVIPTLNFDSKQWRTSSHCPRKAFVTMFDVYWAKYKQKGDADPHMFGRSEVGGCTRPWLGQWKHPDSLPCLSTTHHPDWAWVCCYTLSEAGVVYLWSLHLKRDSNTPAYISGKSKI